MIGFSALAALYKAEKSGKGESIDLAMYETLAGHRPVLPGGLPERGHQVASSWRAQPEPLRDRRVRLQGRLLGRVPLRRRPEQVLPRDHRSGASVGNTRRSPRTRAGCGCRTRMPRRSRRAFEEYCLAHSKYEIEEDFAAHRIAAQVINDMEDLVEEEHLQSARHLGRLGDGRRRDLPRPRRFPEVQEQPRARSGVRCPRRAATPSTFWSRLGYSRGTECRERCRAGRCQDQLNRRDSAKARLSG